MVYPAYPDRKMSYDIDGTIVMYRGGTGGLTPDWGLGPASFMTANQMAEFNDCDYADTGIGEFSRGDVWGADMCPCYVYLFLPEQRVFTAYSIGYTGAAQGQPFYPIVQGSNDSGNGVDGNWESATLTQGYTVTSSDGWRTWYPLTFSGPKQVIRFTLSGHYGGAWNTGTNWYWVYLHLYGHKYTGQTPDDIVFIDTSDNLEWDLDIDFGDVPYLSNLVKSFKIKNTSSTKTANNIALACNDADFTISGDGVNYGTSINVASLAAGVSSSTYYVKCNPAVLTLPGPRASRITSTVGSWT